MIVAGELVAFQAAGALEGDAGWFVAAGGGAEQLGNRSPKLRECESRYSVFSCPQFAVQKPGGDQRERLMVVPADPGADRIIGQAALALAALQALFDAMLRFGAAGQFPARHVGRGVPGAGSTFVNR